MTDRQGEDDTDTGGGASDREWAIDAEIDEDLARVRAGDVTRWFVRDGPLPGSTGTTVCEVEASAWPRSSAMRVDGRPGLLVPRCEGGLLVDALRKRGGMAPSLALGVLDEVLEVLDDAPAAPRGTSRTVARAFAVDDRGDIVVLPGRLRDAASRTDSAELGELLHLALTGRTWEETGLPLALSAPEVPVAVTTLVTDLLEGDGGNADRASLRARVAALGPSRERGFLPAEPGVSDDTAPTGTLGADVVSALRGARPGREGPDTAPRRVGTRRSRPRSARTRRAERRGRGARVRKGRARARFVSMIALCCTGLIAGVGLMVRGATEEAPHTQPRTGSTAVQSPESELSTDDPSASADEPTSVSVDDPMTAVVELSRLRAEAFADGEEEALARLTVPRSPAAAADADLDLDGCEDCADSSRTLEISDVRPAVRSDALHDMDDTGRSDAVWGYPETGEAADGGGSLADGTRAFVSATMRAEGTPPQEVVFVLERHRGTWRVHSVHAV